MFVLLFVSLHFLDEIIDKLDQDMLQIIKDAKEKGLVIKVRHSKVVFCGSSGIGKTNFINLLLQKQFEKSHKPTGVTESHQLLAKPFQVTFVGPESQCKGTECKLEYMDYETQIKWLRWFLSKGNYHSSQSVPLVKHDEPDFNSVISDQLQQISSVEKEIAHDSDILKSNPPDVWNILTFLDTGGQPEFINMLPAVNSSAMITFIMLSMEDGVKGLTNEVTVYGDEPKYSLDYNYIDLIKKLFSMRKTREFQIFKQLLADKNSKGNKNCYLSLVGTKSDLCKGDRVAMAKSIYKKLEPIINQTVRKSSLIPVDRKYFVPVSNCKAGTDDEDPVAAKFRSCIYECLEQRDIFDIPIVWLILELEIQNKAKEVNYIYVDEVFKICQQYNLIIDEEDIRAALKFFHYVGIFLYYGSDDADMKHIADIVITNYQWVFKNLTEMVKAAKCDDDVTGDFRINGRLSVQVMNSIDWKLEREKNVIKKYFLKLLEKLAIISPTKRACTQDEYFMPCVLSTFSFVSSNEQCLLSKYGTQDKAEPLLMQLVYEECDGESYYYDDHSYMLPIGVFCCLINLLLLNNHPRFMVQWSESDNDRRVFNNLITLYDNTENCFVVLIDRFMYLEVQIRQHAMCTVNESVYPNINFIITSTLKDVCDKLRLNNSDICVGFWCSEDNKIYRIRGIYYQTMYGQDNRPKQLKGSQKIWFSGQLYI